MIKCTIPKNTIISIFKLKHSSRTKQATFHFPILLCMYAHIARERAFAIKHGFTNKKKIGTE